MNEKIVELYAEAKRSTKEGKMNAPMGVVAEKFAELIIAESVQFLSDAGCEFEAEQLNEFWNKE